MRCTSNKAKWTDGQTDCGGRSKHLSCSWGNPRGWSGVGLGVGGWGDRHLGVWCAVISGKLFEHFHNKSRFCQKKAVFSHCSTQSSLPHGPAPSLCLIRAHSGELKTHTHVPLHPWPQQPWWKQARCPWTGEQTYTHVSLHTWGIPQLWREALTLATTWSDPENTSSVREAETEGHAVCDSTDGKRPEQANAQTQRVGSWWSEAGEEVMLLLGCWKVGTR